MDAPELLVLGDANPDVLLRGDAVEPRFGQVERVVDDGEVTVGGSGAITACGAARLGVATALVAAVGDDRVGRMQLDAIAARGVDVTGCRAVAGARTGITVVLARGGDRALLTYPGTTGTLAAGDVSPALREAARHVHVSSYFLQAALQPELAALFAAVRARGGTTSLDPNWDPAERWDGGLAAVLAETDLLLLNDAEAARIAGCDDVEEAALALAETAGEVVVKRGSEGAVAVRGGSLARADAVAVDVVDTTGAGDSFDAGYLAARLRGLGGDDALALACACGSLSARAFGGTGGQPSWDEAARASARACRSA